MKGIIAAMMALATAALSIEVAAEDTAEKIFDPSFRSLKTSLDGNFMAPPVMRLASGDRIAVSFDQIGHEANPWLTAELQHCNADWKPSLLVEPEYLDGFNKENIEDYAQSAPVFVKYWNYRLTVPGHDLRPSVSGNYLLRVYDEAEPSEPLLQTRFYTSEDIAGVSGRLTTRTDRGADSQWQQLELAVDLPPELRVNPYSDISVTVMQNGRTATARTLRAPLRVEGSRAIYAHAPELVFPASNEYRRFETVRADYPGMHADSARYLNGRYHTWLTPDSPRDEARYEFDRTQHGRFLIREYNSTDSDLGADYVSVHFTLDAPRYPGADIYVDGEMTHGLFDDTNRMTYDTCAGLYRLEMLLKQGAYNYQYVALPHDGSRPDAAPVEGNHFETQNEYTVLVYYRPPGARADRLIGAATIVN